MMRNGIKHQNNEIQNSEGIGDSSKDKLANNNQNNAAPELEASDHGNGDDKICWTKGGEVGDRGAILYFHCSALSNPPDNPPADKLCMTYKTFQTETKLLAAVLQSHGFAESDSDIEDFNLFWTGVHPKPNVLRSLTPFQKVNHFPRSYELTRKDRIYKNIEKMQQMKGLKHFNIIPQTFVMPGDFREFCSHHYRNKGPWIVKPVASSRGRGISIINTPEEVPQDDMVVVAKYISNPLLIDGHKCDLRLYVAVTSFDPLVIYMYEEGIVRFATVKYDCNERNLFNPCMHLCNYSINKYHKNYVKNVHPEDEDVGHKWTMSALLRYMRAEGMDTTLLMQRIEEVVVKAILAASPSIIVACKMFVPLPQNCFELYGFDILIDSDLKPWLLEVNLSPSLGCDSPLDVRVKSALLVDLLNLIGIPAISPVTCIQKNSVPKTSKKFGCRRVQSADTLATGKKSSSMAHSNLTSSALSLSAEESRIVRNVRAEFSRRGGFVRIFPSQESWKRYGIFLDSVTGISCSSLSGTCNQGFLTPHNYNLLLHQQLFPELKTASLPKYLTSDRIKRYERALSKGHKFTLEVSKTNNLGLSHQEHLKALELKLEILRRLESGSRLSQHQARRAFSQYLICILRRISQRDKENENLNEKFVDLILKFLQRASVNLKSPYYLRLPDKKLSMVDKAAIVAKHLNDFIYQYNRETELYVEEETKTSYIPVTLFHQFYVIASEFDIEEVLSKQTRLYKCSHLYLNRCGTAGASRPLGFLNALPELSKITRIRTQDCVQIPQCNASDRSSSSGTSKLQSRKISRAL